MCRNIRCDIFFVFIGFTGSDLNRESVYQNKRRERIVHSAIVVLRIGTSSAGRPTRIFTRSVLVFRNMDRAFNDEQKIRRLCLCHSITDFI